MAFPLYELTHNPNVQEKAQAELVEVLERHDGNLTYEPVSELHYLDRVIQETLRKHSIVDTITRKVVKPYKVPNMDLILEAGTTVGIPVHRIHHDEQYYPEPERFDPERFTQENMAARPAYTWLPFVEGPRNCVGMRLGLLQSKMGLVVLLNNFRFTTSTNTPRPIKYKVDGLLLAPSGGLFINVERLVK